MVKLLNIDHPATFAISNHSLPYLATASVAGTVDVDFSNKASLQVYSSFGKTCGLKTKKNQPLVSVDIESKVYDLAWSADNSLLAGALESGVVQFYNADKLTNSESEASSSPTDFVVHSATNHSAPVRALAFNNIKQNILLSGSANNEIYIWDTNKLSANESPLTPTGTPYESAASSANQATTSASVGASSAVAKSDEINCLAWNNSISHIFALATTKGITSIWDLKSKKKVLNLNYLSTTQQGSNIRANLSSVVWHPTQSTKLVTVSDLDSLPVILQWELRFSKLPEIIFGNGLSSANNSNTLSTNDVIKGHTKGILSVSWNHADPDFLLTSGKDSQTLLWDMKLQELVASYPLHAQKPATINAMDDYTNKRGEEWVFKTRFANKNPEIFAAASYNGKVVLQTLQDTSSNRPDDDKIIAENNAAEVAVSASKKTSAESETDFWNAISENDSSNGISGSPSGIENEIDHCEDIKPCIFIKKAPKWLSNPCGVKFAPFGNTFVQIKKSDNGMGSQVIIAKMKPDATHSESLKDLKSVLLASEDSNSSDVNDLINKSTEADKDFELLLLESRLELLNAITEEQNKVEDDKNEDKDISNSEANIFDDIAASAEDSADTDVLPTISVYTPSGAFNLFSQDEKEDNLKSLLIHAKFSKFVSESLSQNMITEALIAALNSKDPNLLMLVLGKYFEENKGNVLSRLLFNTSSTTVTTTEASDPLSKISDNIDDLISNANIANWKEIIAAIKCYTELNSDKFNTKLEMLAHRLYSANMREEAIKIYFVSGSLLNLCSIWLEELKEAELKIAGDSPDLSEHKSYSDIYYSLVHHLLIKIFLFKHKLGISLIDNTTFKKLNGLILDFADFVIDDDKELVKLLVASLPENFDGVNIIKIRINEVPEATKTASKKRLGNRLSGVMNGSSNPSMPSNRNKYMIPQQASSPYSPSIPASPRAQPQLSRASNSYAPPSVGNVSAVGSSQVPQASSSLAPPPATNTAKPAKSNHRARYVQTPQPTAPAPMLNGLGVNNNANNPYAPQSVPATNPSMASSLYIPQIPSAPASIGSTYTPQPSFGGVPTGNNFGLSAATPPLISNNSSGSVYSSLQNPSKVKKAGHEGWNDLPDAFAAVTSKATKRKAAPIATAPVVTSMGSSTPGPGTPLSSKILPPPPMGNSRRTSFASNTPPQQMPAVVPPPPQVNKYAPQSSTSAFNSPRMNSTSSFGTPPSQSNSYGAPPQGSSYGAPPQNNLYGAPPQGNSYGAPPQGNSYGAPPQGNSYGAAPPTNPYGAPPQSNSYGTPSSNLQLQQVLAPPPQNGMSGLKSPTAEESIAREEAEAAVDAAHATPAKYPTGDRSHLSPEGQKIYTGLTMKLQYIKPQVPPKYAKKIADTEKKLNLLYDQMNNNELNDKILSLLQQLIDKLEVKDFISAHAIHLDLGTNYTNEASSWFLGIKRVIDLLEAAS